MTIFEVVLESFIDMNHELARLSKQIDWAEVESKFAEYYCADNGRPGVPIRKMMGVMSLKSIYNLSGEGVVARWLENLYMQYFKGEKGLQKRPPMNPVDMKKFSRLVGGDSLIGHLKSDHQMMRNYSKGTRDDALRICFLKTNPKSSALAQLSR